MEKLFLDLLLVVFVMCRFGGYKTGSCTQPESVQTTLRVLLAAPPIILNVISFWFVWKYPITTARAVATRKALQDRYVCAPRLASTPLLSPEVPYSARLLSLRMEPFGPKLALTAQYPRTGMLKSNSHHSHHFCVTCEVKFVTEMLGTHMYSTGGTRVRV